MSKTLTHLILASVALLGLVGLSALPALAVDVTSGTEVWIRDFAPDTTYENDYLDIRRLYTPLNETVPAEVRYGLVDFDLSSLFGTTVTSLEFHVDQLDLTDSGSVGSSADLPIRMVGFMLDMDSATAIGSTTWNTYQAEHAGNETEFETLGTMSLAAPGQAGGGFRFATGSAADIALVQNIIDNSGTLTMVIQPTDPGFNIAASFGDNEVLGENSFLRINDVTSPYSFTEQLSLHVNRFTGNTRIVADDAPPDTNTILVNTELDSYTMGSTSLNNVWVPANWNSITDQDGGDWEEVDPTAPVTTQNALTELNLNGSKSFSPGQSVSLGNVYDTSDASKDIGFGYGRADKNVPIAGEVVIEGGIHLRVNKSTGKVEIVNGETLAIDVDGYIIKSASGDLNTGLWNSLEDQSVTGWGETNASSSAISELNLDSSTLLAAGNALNLGTPYQGDVNGTEDMSFQYSLVTGQIPEDILDGVVEYIVAGDMDGDGDVDADDVPLFVQALVNRGAYNAIGFTNSAGFLVDADIAGDVNGNGTFDFGDISAFSLLVTSATGSATAVPEPGTATLLLLASCVLTSCASRRTKR